jgi:hypothetical protein
MEHDDESKEKEKKERVLHTRIPESLDEEIRQQAGRLGVSVSNLVRNVLQNAVGLVGDIVADTTQLARLGRREEPPSAAKPTILGWQEVVLNVNAICDTCNAILPRGARAALALADGANVRAFRCLACLEELARGNSAPKPE